MNADIKWSSYGQFSNGVCLVLFVYIYVRGGGCGGVELGGERGSETRFKGAVSMVVLGYDSMCVCEYFIGGCMEQCSRAIRCIYFLRKRKERGRDLCW